MFKAKKYRGAILMVLKIDTKLEGKRTFAFKNDMKNLTDFFHMLKNKDFILESKMAELM